MTVVMEFRFFARVMSAANQTSSSLTDSGHICTMTSDINHASPQWEGGSPHPPRCGSLGTLGSPRKCSQVAVGGDADPPYVIHASPQREGGSPHPPRCGSSGTWDSSQNSSQVAVGGDADPPNNYCSASLL
jgi:hypothetical protein